jgi:uncharacterized protein YdaU (DUF1376 family)
MSKPDSWMPIYWSDFLVDTAHLNDSETGAYLLLLAHCWMRGGTLPDSNADLARMARVDTDKWPAIRERIAPFFTVNGVWTQKRLTAELTKAQGIYTKAVEHARKRWDKAKAADPTPDLLPPDEAEMPPDMRPHMRPHEPPHMRPHMPADEPPDMPPDMRPDMRPDMPNACQPQPQPQHTKVKVKNSCRVAPDGFEEFWKRYPDKRRVAKVKCLEVWTRRKLEAESPAILAHVAAMRRTDAWRSGYEPAPLTYLNQSRWQDGLPADPALLANGKRRVAL